MKPTVFPGAKIPPKPVSPTVFKGVEKPEFRDSAATGLAARIPVIPSAREKVVGDMVREYQGRLTNIATTLLTIPPAQVAGGEILDYLSSIGTELTSTSFWGKRRSMPVIVQDIRSNLSVCNPLLVQMQETVTDSTRKLSGMLTESKSILDSSTELLAYLNSIQYGDYDAPLMRVIADSQLQMSCIRSTIEAKISYGDEINALLNHRIPELITCLTTISNATAENLQRGILLDAIEKFKRS